MRTLRRRVERLEALQAAKLERVEYWYIPGRLPKEYVGERHLVVRRQWLHWIEAEERPGPGPQDSEPIYVDLKNGLQPGLPVYGYHLIKM